MKLHVIFIVHNQFELMKNGLDMLRVWAGINQDDVVIVDNASEDGLQQWLYEQKNLNYIVCENEMEGYAVILNTVIREFQITGDILVLSPNFIVLPNTIEQMQRVLYSQERVGAVSAATIPYGSEHGKEYLTAVDYAQNTPVGSSVSIGKLGLEPGAVMIKSTMREEVGEFDLRLILPQSCMMDFMFRGIIKGYQLLECQEVFLFQSGVSGIEYLQKFGDEVDRDVLKEKWDMNYFNDRPNENLISCIQKDKEEDFNILEVGCDCGVNLLEVKNRFPNVKLYGLELNDHAAEIASCIAEVKVGNIEDRELQYEDVKFDYIIFGDVLEHLRDPAATVRYCRLFLNDNGRIIASIPNLMHYSVMRGLIDGYFTYKDTGLLDRTHIHFFTYNEIIRMFDEEGYEIENIYSVVSPQEVTREDSDFIVNLVNMSRGAEGFMFHTFQYIVSAKKKGENIKDV